MEAGKDVKETALLSRWQVNAGIYELPPGCKLSGQEPETQKSPNDEPALHALHIVAANSSFRNFHGHTAEQKNGCIRPEQERQFDILPGWYAPQDNISTGKAGKQHDHGRQKDPSPNLPLS